MNIPIENQKAFIREFEAIRPVYKDFAILLEQILLKAVDHFGYLGIVQARAKKVASFSTKIILKDKYKNPLTDMTDLCGARVILHFQSHVEKICAFIRENFEIDEANSLDLKSKLKVNEFGYRSVHYIVTPKKDLILGILVNEKFKTLKAEIQVRTLAEHVWADISHDRIYKTELTIPEEWKREAARLSAILEDADISFASISQAIDSVSNVYELQYEKKKAVTDIEKLKTLTDIQVNEPGEGVKNVLKLVSVYRALNKPQEAKQVLSEWITRLTGEPVLLARLQFELVMLEMTAHCRDIHSAVYIKGMKDAEKLLIKIQEKTGKNNADAAGELSFLYFRFGCLLQNDQEKESEALDMISRAYDLMPQNPLYFIALLETIVFRNIDMAHRTISLFRNTIEKAITDLGELITLGIDRIPAWFAVGRCHFFLGNKMECITAYANAVETILNEKYTTNRCTVEAEIDRAGRLRRFDKKLAQQIRLYLNIAMAVSKENETSENYKVTLEDVQIRKEPIKTPVIIVAGGASLMDETKIDSYGKYIEELMLDFRGTIISGGTTAGIPGLVGRIKAEIQQKIPPYFDLLSYLPHELPGDAIKSDAYDHFYEIDSDEFSVLDIITCWTDIILSGIRPSDVILIGIDGGKFATMEYRIALSLGAKVCLVAYSGRAVSDFIHERTWKNHPNLIEVPEDPLTIWALVNQSVKPNLTTEETAKLAPMVHEFYRKQQLKSLKSVETDINKYKVVMEWEKLDPALQKSNIKQVEFYEHILKRVNLAIRKAEKPVLFNIRENVSKESYDLLARLEHARWNAERLIEGWKFGKVKDLVNKLNPYIVAWDDLDEEIKKYDYDPVDNIPGLLAGIGYEVCNM
jgi:ppGpp synthetase/RelA/SpoT-type nucleotidyltranferase